MPRFHGLVTRVFRYPYGTSGRLVDVGRVETAVIAEAVENAGTAGRVDTAEDVEAAEGVG